MSKKSKGSIGRYSTNYNEKQTVLNFECRDSGGVQESTWRSFKGLCKNFKELPEIKDQLQSFKASPTLLEGLLRGVTSSSVCKNR